MVSLQRGIYTNRCIDRERRSHVRVAGMPQCDVWSSFPPPMGHLQLSTSHKTDRGNERWGIYLPSWHCFCLVSSELTHLLKCWVETSTYYGAELLSRDCVLCVFVKAQIEMNAELKGWKIKRWHHHSYHLCIYTKGQRDNWNEHSNRNCVCIFIVIHLQWAHFNSVCLI